MLYIHMMCISIMSENKIIRKIHTFSKCAGAMVYRKNNGLEFLLLQDTSGYWTFPKGHMRQEEGKQDTARREIEEEIGVKNIKFDDFCTSIYYIHEFDYDIDHKVVYLFSSNFDGQIRISKEHKAYNWICLKDALDAVYFLEQKKALAKLFRFLN